MIARRDILVLANDALTAALAGHLPQAAITSRSDPYDALMDMGMRRWPTVILSADEDDFAGLCRAARQLQADSRLLGMCETHQEPTVRKMVGSLLDDYFILPARAEELAEVLSHSHEPVPANGGGKLPPQIIARLIESARDTVSLEAELAAVVSALIGQDADWADAAPAETAAVPLLLVPGPPPRALLTAGRAALSSDAAAALESLKVLLPALAQTASRTASLHRLAITDHLTGAFNRRYFYHLTDEILHRSRNPGDRIALLLYDIDDFKQYNDKFGYNVGDEILRQTAALMKKICRNQDVVARIGGDEFAVLFWDSQGLRSPQSQPLHAAADLAERFRQAVSREEFPLLGPQAVGHLTISGGLAMYPRDGQDVRQLLRSADQALKKGKKAGKNTIQIIGQ